MILILPPGSGKTHSHRKGHGLDIESVLQECLGNTVFGHIGYTSEVNGPRYYHRFGIAMTRALLKMFPASLDPKEGVKDAVDILTNYFHVPEEVPRENCHFISLSEDEAVENYAARRQNSAAGMLYLHRRSIDHSSEFGTMKLGLSRKDVEEMSKKWKPAPKLSKDDYVWLREQIFADKGVLDLVTTGKYNIEELRKVVENATFHIDPYILPVSYT